MRPGSCRTSQPWEGGNWGREGKEGKMTALWRPGKSRKGWEACGPCWQGRLGGCEPCWQGHNASTGGPQNTLWHAQQRTRAATASGSWRVVPSNNSREERERDKQEKMKQGRDALQSRVHALSQLSAAGLSSGSPKALLPFCLLEELQLGDSHTYNHAACVSCWGC